jgi:hypothetical protein
LPSGVPLASFQYMRMVSLRGSARQVLMKTW